MTLRSYYLLEEQEMGLHSHAAGVAAFTPTNVTSCVTCVSSVALVQDLLVIGAVRNSNRQRKGMRRNNNFLYVKKQPVSICQMQKEKLFHYSMCRINSHFCYVICKRKSFSCPRHNKPLETLQILYFTIIYTNMNDSIL